MNNIHTFSYNCDRPECIKAQRDELAAAAEQEAVSWTVVGPDGKSSIGGWQDMKTHDFWQEAGVLREGHRYAYAYAAPVTAAPAVAYLIDGRTEQGLTFDKAAAETMAFANGGTVRALGFVDGAPAAQEVVGWQRKYLGATRGGRPVDWHNITREEFEQTKSGKWADKYDVRELFASPVTAAPADTWFADQLTAMGEVIPLASTPAAPGIDLRNAILQLREDALHMKDPGDTVNAYNRVLALIDASPNGALNEQFGIAE